VTTDETQNSPQQAASLPNSDISWKTRGSIIHVVRSDKGSVIHADNEDKSNEAIGVSGSVAGAGIGVEGRTGESGIGVKGVCDPDQNGTGVFGHGGRAGTGVRGAGIDKFGVHGVVSGGRHNVGVRGESNINPPASPDLEGIGVEGISGSGVGAVGRSTAARGIGVGAVATSNGGTGVQAIGDFIGVVGSSATTPNTIGVLGFSAMDAPGDLSRALTHESYELRGPFDGLGPQGSTGVRGIGTAVGVSGLAEGNGGIGVLGVAYSVPENSYAGYFAGKVVVTEKLQVNDEMQSYSASFSIDHPLTPTTHVLQHAFVASPERQICYSGNITLDDTGNAQVAMPSYVEALGTEFRYQLTPIGGPAPNLHISQTIQNGHFTIAGGTPHLIVSWQITGVRQDTYTIDNPLVVEQPKEN
jgi:hypothetical protein